MLCRKLYVHFSCQWKLLTIFAHSWDENFQKKPAYDAILEAYSGASPATGTNTTTSVSAGLSTGVSSSPTVAPTSSASEVAPVATGEAECAVEYVYQ